MKKAIQRLFASVLIVSLFALTGCNTFKGMGRDIESLGQTIQDAGQ